LSRIVGVVRQRVFAYFLGTSDAMDAFQAAFRIPNFLQNVFGEGALSASFIPVYARLLAQDDEEEAGRVAWEEEADRVAWSVVWNVTLIAALVVAGWSVRGVSLADLGTWGRVAALAAWGSVVGSALQFAVQLPTVLTLLRRVRLALGARNVHVRTVLRNFFPVFVSRGVVQISAFVDAWLASWLGTGAVAALNYSQSLYTLPVSLFGISVSAAELPEMSS